MDARDLLYGVPAEVIAAVARVSLSTARRYKRSGRLSAAHHALLELVIAGELGAIAPAWRGFLVREDLLWTPHGFALTPGQLCAIPYRLAQLAALERAVAEPQQWALFKDAIASEAE
jgi:hypothetical protein